MIGLIAAAIIMGAFGLWLLNALWSLDHNPHGGAPEERCAVHWSCSRVCERGTKGCDVQHGLDGFNWKEGYDD
jgi:hypothetical protein